MDDLNQQLGLEEELESIEPLGDAAPSSRELRGQLEALSNQLVWKIGKDEDSERIVVRVGYARATASFRALPKLRGATDTEIADAAKAGELIVEWIE